MNWNNLVFRVGMDLTKLTMVSIIVGTTFCLCALAQTKSDAVLDAKGLASLVVQLKNSLAKEVEDEELQTSIIEKWDAQMKDLVGKTAKQVINLLLADVKSVVNDAEKVNQLKESFIALASNSALTEESKEKPVDEPKNPIQPNSNSTSAAMWDNCPPFPSALAGVLRWEVLRVPDMLLCRALLTDSGTEAFAMIIGRNSPFKPRRSDRAESVRLNGREVFWYSSKSAKEPNVQMREMLIQIDEDRVVHVTVRANDAKTLSKYQEYALSLPFPDYEE